MGLGDGVEVAQVCSGWGCQLKGHRARFHSVLVLVCPSNDAVGEVLAVDATQASYNEAGRIYDLPERVPAILRSPGARWNLRVLRKDCFRNVLWWIRQTPPSAEHLPAQGECVLVGDANWKVTVRVSTVSLSSFAHRTMLSASSLL
jgi:hypothetical protein